MVFRRTEPGEQRDEEDGLNVYSGDDEEGEPVVDLFEPGQRCDICQSAEGRIGIDPTCRGLYEAEPVLACADCAGDALASRWDAVEGIAVVVEPFGEYDTHYYYRLDEMPAYSFVREDVEAISWVMLTIGDACARCGEQSRVAWLTKHFVDERLPEGRRVFRNLDETIEHLCGRCAGTALASIYTSMELPLMTVEIPRAAMGVLMPTGE
jgi:hypothetical protein